MTIRTLLGLFTSFALAACGPMGMPELTVSLTPSSFSDATPITVRVVATTGDGSVGQGTVRLTATAGEFDPAMVKLDSFGTGTAKFVCDATIDPECASGTVKVTATWSSVVQGVVQTATGEARATYVVVTGTDGGLSDGGAEALRTLSQVCSPPTAGRPGLSATCCEPRAIGGHDPHCGSFIVSPNVSFSINFNAYSDPLFMNLLQADVPYGAILDPPARSSTMAQCSGHPGLQVIINNVPTSVSATVSEGVVETDGKWNPLYAGAGTTLLNTMRCKTGGAGIFTVGSFLSFSAPLVQGSGGQNVYWRSSDTAQEYIYTVPR